MAKAAPTRAMAPMQIFVARAVAPDGGPVGHLVLEVIVMGTRSQGHSCPLTVHLDSVTVEPVDVDVPVDVEVDVMEDSSVMLLVATQGLALLISAWLHPRSAGGTRKVIFPSNSISQPGHAVALQVMVDSPMLTSQLQGPVAASKLHSPATGAVKE